MTTPEPPKLDSGRPDLIIFDDIVKDPVFCRDCSHLIGVRINTMDWERWTCGETRKGFNLVSGKPLAQTCTKAREEGSLCGPIGKLYIEYVKPDFYTKPSVEEPIITSEGRQLQPVDMDQLKAKVAERMGKTRKKVTNEDLDNL